MIFLKILNESIDRWPVVDALFSFYSSHFPLEKAVEYQRLVKPFTINSLPEQRFLMDRRIMYSKLIENNIKVPRHVFLNRDGFNGEGESVIEEFDDWIIINSVRIDKPFVEKPVDADDHNIYIYYPKSAGGGSKRLFRKVGDKSSEFYPDVHCVRKDGGSYIYEEFMPTGGTDVKVYAVVSRRDCPCL